MKKDVLSGHGFSFDVDFSRFTEKQSDFIKTQINKDLKLVNILKKCYIKVLAGEYRYMKLANYHILNKVISLTKVL